MAKRLFDEERNRAREIYASKPPVGIEAIRNIQPGQSVTVKWLWDEDDTFLVLETNRPAGVGKSKPPNALLLWAPNGVYERLFVAINPRSPIKHSLGAIWPMAYGLEEGFDSIIRIGAVDIVFK